MLLCLSVWFGYGRECRIETGVGEKCKKARLDSACTTLPGSTSALCRNRQAAGTGRGAQGWHRGGDTERWDARTLWWPWGRVGDPLRGRGGPLGAPHPRCPHSTTTTRTPASRSRKPLRRTSSTRPTAQTVRSLCWRGSLLSIRAASTSTSTSSAAPMRMS